MDRIVVVGAGQAGVSLTAALRKGGFDGAITLIGAEPYPPYQRPPLSKDYLLGKLPRERLYLKPQKFFDDNDIELVTSSAVTAIDPARRVVQTAGGEIAYDQLALTTGATPKELPQSVGGLLQGVLTLRGLGCVDAIAHHFQPGANVVVAGGGYIGLEGAAVAAQSGLEVTVIEREGRILSRVACPETAEYFRDLHRRHGVTIREDVGEAQLIGAQGKVEGARLGDERLDADFVIVGIGVSPNTDLARAAGLEVDNGIVVDAFGRTSDPTIWAAGDCARFPLDGRMVRLESVQNAIDQAEAVAANMLGAETAYDPVPWFWSDQYDVKLQIAGLHDGYDRLVVCEGSEPGAVSHWYYRGETLLAVDAMNAPKAYMVGKRLLEAGRSPAAEAVADAGENPKVLLA